MAYMRAFSLVWFSFFSFRLNLLSSFGYLERESDREREKQIDRVATILPAERAYMLVECCIKAISRQSSRNVKLNTTV